MKFTQDPYFPLLGKTQTSSGFAKFNHLTMIILKMVSLIISLSNFCYLAQICAT